MKYFPHLIPEEHRVLKDRFEKNSESEKVGNESIKIIFIILGILLIVGALIPASTFFPFSMVLITTGMLLFPKLNQALAKQFRFQITNQVGLILGGVLLLTNVLFGLKFVQIRNELIQQEETRYQFDLQAQREAEQKEYRRQDKLSTYLSKTDSLVSLHQTDQAISALASAEKFVLYNPEQKDINQKRLKLFIRKAADLEKQRNYIAAIGFLDKAHQMDEQNSEVIYQRAICYSKSKNIRAAVADCRLAMELGNSEAEKLHDQINPIRKRITGTVTLCRDGTTSGATGRGACSHHGGVANWNYPVYEEYRKY